VAKLLQMHGYITRNSAAASPKKEPLDSGLVVRNHFLPIHVPERVIDFSRRGSSPRFSIGAEARLLLVIGVGCGLFIFENNKKPTVTIPKDAQLQTQVMPAQPARPLAKPTPIVPAQEARVEPPTPSKQTAVAHIASAAPHYPPTTYEATRKKVFGSCTGQLDLTSSGLVFRCPKQADLIFPVAEIAAAHKDGIVLKSGEKYHFLIANRTRGQAEAIFLSWLSRVQQFPQSSRVSSF
jgi:hypothetical protein